VNVIDRRGVLRARHLGFVESRADVLRAELEGLLAETGGSP
jgi:hypothetical protein